MEKWRFGDPAKVYERIEEQRLRPSRNDRARQGLEALFKGDNMGRRLEIPGYVEADMYQWGDWARRPNFWANLRITPFCNLLPIVQERTREPNVRLDPQSLAIHRAVLGLQSIKTQVVLYAYFVAGCVWTDHEKKFKHAGISKATFYRLLIDGSLMAHNRSGVAKTLDIDPKLESETINSALYSFSARV